MAVSQNGWTVNPPRSARTVPGTSVKLVVANGPAGDVLMHLAAEFNRRVEGLSGPVQDDWGWADRKIAGTNVISNHASATAIDLNATRHPQGRRGTFTAGQVRELRAILAELGGVVRWGGDYTGKVDEMHFEINAPYGPVSDVAHRLNGTVPPKPTPPPNGRPTLRRGSTGPFVSELQSFLNRNYPRYSNLLVDGVFGPQTERVVREFQKRSRINVDGIVGPVTWRKLGF